MTIVLRSTIGVDRDLPLVRYFVEHYRALGVDRFLLILHSRDTKAPHLRKAADILEEYNIAPSDVWITDSWNTGENAQRHRNLVSALVPESWVISADIDEFHEYPMPLPAFTSKLAAGGYNVVKGRLIQRVSSDFRLHPLNQHQSLWDQFPTETEFGIGNPGKVVLHRNYILTTPGHHAVDDDSARMACTYPTELKVLHFKWYQGVSHKFVDPLMMAHHSETWEFQAYEKLIRRTFFGWGRRINVLTHHELVRPALCRARTMVALAKRFAKRIIGRPSAAPNR